MVHPAFADDSFFADCGDLGWTKPFIHNQPKETVTIRV